jgi:hypothetical protein
MRGRIQVGIGWVGARVLAGVRFDQLRMYGVQRESKFLTRYGSITW